MSSENAPRTFPKVFVITLNWNGMRWLPDCLASIWALDYPNFEVVVVDNGSSDESVRFVRREYPRVHVLENGANLGYARGFNAGLVFAAARGAEYFLVMNNDTVIEAAALQELVRTAQSRPRSGFVTGKVYFFDHPNVLQTVGKVEDPLTWNGDHIGWQEDDHGQHESEEERVFVDDIMTLVDRRLFDEVGGYDPQFFLQSEEFDWQARAKKAGWKFYYTARAKLWHRVSMSMGGWGNPVGRYFDVRSQMVVMARYRTLAQFLRYYVVTGWRCCNSFIRGLARFNWIVLKPRAAMLLGFLGGSLWLLHRRPAVRVPWIVRLLA